MPRNKQEARMNQNTLRSIDIAIQGWLIRLGTRRLPSTGGTDKGHDTTLELDKRHLTFLITISICCRCNYYRSPDNLSDTDTRRSQSVRIFTVRLSLCMHDTGLGLALLRFCLTISVAGVSVPEACQLSPEVRSVLLLRSILRVIK